MYLDIYTTSDGPVEAHRSPGATFPHEKVLMCVCVHVCMATDDVALMCAFCSLVLAMESNRGFFCGSGSSDGHRDTLAHMVSCLSCSM